MDRAEIRRRNFIASDELPYTTVTHQRYDSGDYALALERALALVGYAGFGEERRAALERGRLLGLGIASYVEYTGMGSQVFHGRGMVGIAGHDSAWMRLGADGRVTVWTSVPAIGKGVATTYAQLAAASLGVDVRRSRGRALDTAARARAGGPGRSRAAAR